MLENGNTISRRPKVRSNEKSTKRGDKRVEKKKKHKNDKREASHTHHIRYILKFPSIKSKKHVKDTTVLYGTVLGCILDMLF